MNILIGLLIVVEILVSILLTLIILIQPSKSGGGLGGALGGGGMGEQLFGARTGNVLTKATILFATVFLLNTVALAFLYSRQDRVTLAPPPSPGISADAETGEEDVVPETLVEPEEVVIPVGEEDLPEDMGTGVLEEDVDVEPETAPAE